MPIRHNHLSLSSLCVGQKKVCWKTCSDSDPWGSLRADSAIADLKKKQLFPLFFLFKFPTIVFLLSAVKCKVQQLLAGVCELVQLHTAALL